MTPSLLSFSAAVTTTVATAAVVESPTSLSPAPLNVTTNGAASSIGASPLERLDNLIKGSTQAADASVHSNITTATAGCSTIKGQSFTSVFHTDWFLKRFLFSLEYVMLITNPCSYLKQLLSSSLDLLQHHQLYITGWPFCCRLPIRVFQRSPTLTQTITTLDPPCQCPFLCQVPSTRVLPSQPRSSYRSLPVYLNLLGNCSDIFSFRSYFNVHKLFHPSYFHNRGRHFHLRFHYSKIS